MDGGGGVKLPIIFSINSKIYGLRKGSIVLGNSKERIFVGFGGTKGIASAPHTYINIGSTGKIIFKGKAVISEGTSIRVDNGICIFGKNFSCNKNCSVSCTKSVEFGENCLLGWNVAIRDSDGHTIFKDGMKKESLQDVRLGDNIWIAANVDILKGVYIASDNVISYRSCVTKSFDERHCLIGGYPAKILQRNISWEK